ncbi:endonuclease domain-containing protein [Mycobacterium lehmannii]|uniref:endonuclease domain-containing protein n=1 Tax=Mycobacterium lehmannii TaxID=2048550 RepID=UPI000B93CF54|nr:DUF559 domain-containing protein [Mycobacterium lehmannii]
MVPFVGTEALAVGAVTRYQLRTRYRMVHRNVYVPRDHVLSAVDKAVAAWLWSRREATLVGLSAAAMYGSKFIDGRLPAEVHRRSRDRPAGIVVHSGELSREEIRRVRGILVSTPARTAFDLGRRYGRTLAVIRVDALLQATSLKLRDVEALIEQHRGARGVVQLREVIKLADPGAESPQESRTRLVLTDAGIRPTHTQIDVFERYYNHVGRIDMGYPKWKVGVEYDGAQHWTNPRIRAADIERQARLEALDWRIVRVSAEMLRYRPHTIVERTLAALRAAGCSSVELLS